MHVHSHALSHTHTDTCLHIYTTHRRPCTHSFTFSHAHVPDTYSYSQISTHATHTHSHRTHIHTQSSLHLCKDPPSLEPSSSQCALVSTKFTAPEWLQRSVQHEGLQILKVKSLLHRRKSLSVVRPLGPTMSEC